ncbi:MAG: helix-turn-helix domain-containing protein [Fibrobacterota bacterium]
MGGRSLKKNVKRVILSVTEGLENKRFFLIFPVVLLIITVILNQNSTQKAFPLPKESHVYKQVDSNLGGEGNSSVLDLQVSDSLLAYNFSLGSRLDYPYAGVGINFIDTTVERPHGLNLQGYDYVTIEIASSAEMLNLAFTSFVDGYTDMESPMSWRVFENLVGVADSFRVHTIDLKEFTTPPWWYQENQIGKEELPPRNLSNIISFIIENNDYESFHGTPETVQIRSIVFHRDLRVFNIAVAAILIVYISLYIYLSRYLENGGPVVIPYKELDVSSYEDEDADKVERYIADNYQNQDLLVRDVSTSTGVTQAKIQTVLKNKFAMTFRQYLNRIRIYEAKRLLRETDRQVTDIAYKVGYRNVSHFNRIFKEKEGLSPNKYRKQK